MIYFDNAATSGFKPSRSIDAAVYAMKFLNANAGRSGHKLALTCAEAVFSARQSVAALFNAKPDRVVFTQNCTHALNAAIYGIYEKGSHVITTVTEHNSVLRPLFDLEKRGEITLTIICPTTGGVTAKDVEKALTEKTRLVVMSATSNVTGTDNDVYGVGKLLKGTGIKFVVDGAQAAGHEQLDVKKLNCDALCVAGHKGLYSVQGVGAIILGDNAIIRPFIRGGTGSDTFNADMPEDYPEKLEGGTLNLPAICSLKEGADYCMGNVSYCSGQLTALTDCLITALGARPFIKLYSLPNAAGIVAFSHAEIPSQELASILSDKYDIAVRGGYHCAPLMHRYLGTEKFGLVRVSASPMNTRKEIRALIDAIDEISFTAF